MKFFSDYQKTIAMQCSSKRLHREYKKSERDLKKIARCGDENKLAMVMKQHSNIEYAMLFQKTPNFKKEVKEICQRKN